MWRASLFRGRRDVHADGRTRRRRFFRGPNRGTHENAGKGKYRPNRSFLYPCVVHVASSIVSRRSTTGTSFSPVDAAPLLDSLLRAKIEEKVVKSVRLTPGVRFFGLGIFKRYPLFSFFGSFSGGSILCFCGGGGGARRERVDARTRGRTVGVIFV